MIRPNDTESLLTARTSDGNSALLLACHAGSAACVRLLLAGGALRGARNDQGLGAAELAVCGACSATADMSDNKTQDFEDVLTQLAAEHQLATHDHDSNVHSVHATVCTMMRTIATAPKEVPLRRLLSLTLLLKRLSLAPATEAVAQFSDRPLLHALLAAVPPPSDVIVCLRKPLEGERVRQEVERVGSVSGRAGVLAGVLVNGSVGE